MFMNVADFFVDNLITNNFYEKLFPLNSVLFKPQQLIWKKNAEIQL